MSWIKDVSYEISKLDISTKILRKFGITVGIIFIIIGFWIIYKDVVELTKFVFLSVGIILLFSGLFLPKSLRSTYKIWMGFAFAMGWLMSRVILSVLFILVITPIGIFAKLFKKEFLDVKFHDGKKSYWIPKESKNSNYEKMY